MQLSINVNAKSNDAALAGLQSRLNEVGVIMSAVVSSLEAEVARLTKELSSANTEYNKLQKKYDETWNELDTIKTGHKEY